MDKTIHIFLFLLLIKLYNSPVSFAQAAGTMDLQRGLITWLPFDEASGSTALDASGKSRAAQLINGGTWHSQGKINGCIRLTNAEAIHIPLQWQPTAFSISWWVYADRGTVTNWTQAVGANLNAGDAWQGFLFHASASGKIYTGTDASTWIESAANEFQVDVWQHFVFTFERGEAALYKNGRRIAYRSAGMTMPAPWSQLAIGSSTNSALSAAGYYDDFRVYDRAVSVEEANNLMTASPLPYVPSADVDRNWALERSFDGNGNVIGESKQFMDALGRPTQAQAKNMTTGHVLATQTVYSSGGQPVLTTLPAPTNNREFRYKPGFLRAGGKEYSYTNFEGAKVNNPDPLDYDASPGTLRYYYSSQNTWEPLTASTNYPFSLTEPYEGPLGGIKRAAGPGDELRMGQGHEVKAREVPLLDELTDYLSLRSLFVPTAAGVSLKYQGLKSVTIDANGRESITFTDKEGQVLATCLSGSQYPGMQITGIIQATPANVTATTPPYQDIHIPAAETTVTLTIKGSGGLLITDLLTGTSSQLNAPGTLNLTTGFYRLISLKGIQTFSYLARYGEFSYSYYDDARRLVATIAPKGTLPANLVQNAGFEQDQRSTNTPSRWTNTGTTGASYTQPGGAHAGTYIGVHYSPNAYTAITSQRLQNLPNGRYTLRAWTKNYGGGQVARMVAKGYGDVPKNANVPLSPDFYNGPWQLVEITGIHVTSGQCDISFESQSPAGGYCILFDDVEFIAEDRWVQNASFEQESSGTTTPSGWSTDPTTTPGTSFTETYGGGHTGAYHGTHFSGQGAYNAYTSQVVKGLPTGTYTLRAWVKGSGGQPIARLLAKGYGGAEQWATIGATVGGPSGEWTLVEVPNLIVTNGQCEIGLWSKASQASQFIYFDDVELVRQDNAGRSAQFVTRHTYSGAGTLLSTESTDEGKTDYVYARDGRIRFSQSAQQRLEGKFSYSNYDQVGRVVESGEYTMAANRAQGFLFEGQLTAAPTTNSVLTLLEDRTPTGGLDQARCSQRNQVWYDLPATDSELGNRTQDFVLGAVAKTSNGTATTWYSYDELGRVTWLVQRLPGVGVKTVEYTYDFLGNVLEVAYQKGQPDAFYHHYRYDADQRLHTVHTSTDGQTKTQQARYVYYLHGPLKRVELATDLQGLDYAYTVQGWLKSINSATRGLDPGRDAPKTNGMYKDLFGLTLDYFSGDYRSGQFTPLTPAVAGKAARYDGVVRSTSWFTPPSPEVRMNAFTYDTKGQLLQSDFGKLSGSSFLPDAQQAYEEGALQYDVHGNIQRLRRRDGAGWATDDFSYQYTANTNKLAAVNNQNGQAVLDYDYDAIGQMTRQRDEQGQRYFRYDVTGKVTGVYRDANQQQPVALFVYDDRGFRVSKASYTATGQLAKTTYYVRDAAGNELSTYEQEVGKPLVRAEVPLYGSGRVGTIVRQEDGRDDARYELNDQLGNARVVFHRPATTRYTATMEPSQQTNDDAQFQNLSQPRVAGQGLQGTYATVVTGSAAGPAKRLTVQKGDTITFSAFVQGSTTGGRAINPASISAFAVAGSLSSTPELGVPIIGTEYTKSHKASRTTSKVIAGVSITGLLHSLSHNRTNAVAATTGTSTVYLRCQYYDQDGKLQDTKIKEVSSTDWQEVQLGFRVPEAGTVVLSSGLSSGAQATFDNVTYEQTDNLIVQEQHQYAFGAPITGLSYTIGNKRYRHGYQGQYAEKDEETGFDSFELRQYNSRIGRWMATDPEGQFHSPYVGMGNNPITGVDPNGGWNWTGAAVGLGAGAVIGGGIAAMTGGSIGKGAAIGAGAGFILGGVFVKDFYSVNSAGTEHTVFSLNNPFSSFRGSGAIGPINPIQSSVSIAPVNMSVPAFLDGAQTVLSEVIVIGHIPTRVLAEGPVGNAHINSAFGVRRGSIAGAPAGTHPGTDFRARAGTPQVATADGIVARSYTSSSYGNVIIINHGPAFEKGTGSVYTLYAHGLSGGRLVGVGVRVHVGQPVLLTGSTGFSSAPHVHYEVIRTTLSPSSRSFFGNIGIRYAPNRLPSLLYGR